MSSFLSLVEQYDQRTLRNNEILAAFEKESGYEIVQSNGQRICGPPPELKSKRVLLKGTEVFIGKLPRDCLENEIFLFCSRAGQIYQMRLMVNFSGDNRGYCFVKYCTFQAAYNAVSILNNTYIRPGHRVGVALSSDNTRLQVLCINPTVTNEAISQELKAKTGGFIDCTMTDMANGYKEVVLDYEDHRHSALAKRYIKTQIGEGRWGMTAIVKWAFCPLTQARNRRKKENKIRKIKQEQIMEHLASTGLLANGSCDSMSTCPDKENSCMSWSSSDAPSTSSMPDFQRYPILGRNNQQSFNKARSPMTESGYNKRSSLSPYSDSFRPSATSSLLQTGPMTESGYNMRSPLSPYSDSFKPSATSSLLQTDDEAGAIKLMPPHFDIMGRTRDNTSHWPVMVFENLMEDVQNLEHNTSNAQAYNAPPLKIEPQQYNLTIPELPNRFNNLNYTPKFNINAGVLPGPSPLSHISNPPPLETWSNFNQNGLVNNNPIGKIETSHQHLNNNESEISYGLPRPIVKCDTMRNTALETFDRNHYALQRPQIAQASVFGSKNNFQSYNMISEQDGRESRNGFFNNF